MQRTANSRILPTTDVKWHHIHSEVFEPVGYAADDFNSRLAFDIQELDDHPEFGVIEGLHGSLRQVYAEPEEAAA